MKLNLSKEWWTKKLAEEEGEVGAGFESAFVDAGVFVDYLRGFIVPTHDPEADKNNPNLYRYEEDEEGGKKPRG